MKWWNGVCDGIRELRGYPSSHVHRVVEMIRMETPKGLLHCPLCKSYWDVWVWGWPR